MLRRDVLTNGIDVSQYQGLINWEVVKNHIDFAIIRCGYGQDIIGQDDELFKRNADECTRLNIPFGVYLSKISLVNFVFHQYKDAYIPTK